MWIIVRTYLRIHVEGRERLPGGPAIYCFNHLGWVDPFILMAVLPFRPRLFFFGPKEEDMHVGGTEPHHVLDRDDDPVSTGQGRPARGDPSGRGGRGERRRRGHRR